MHFPEQDSGPLKPGPLVPIPPIPKRRLGSWLDAYLQFTANSEVPDHFHWWVGISTLAGALRRQVWIDMKRFQWVPCFYIIFVAPPGIISKSTTASIGMDLLREIDGIHFGPDVVTWQALIQSMAQAGEMVPLPNGDYINQSAVTIFASELGTFFNPKDRELVDALTALWDGRIGPFQKWTKTQGSDEIINPWINFIGCTTPKWIAEHVPEYMIGGGFTSRCVLVYADAKVKLIPYPDESAPANYDLLRKDLIHDLEVVSMLRGEFTITEEARVWGRQWYETHWREAPKKYDSEVYGNYLARKQTHIHKLAMVLSAAERNDLTITPVELSHADIEITRLESTMRLVFSTIGQSIDAKRMGEILDVIRQRRSMPYGNLYQHLACRMSHEEFRKGFDSALAAGYVRMGQAPKGNAPWVFWKGGHKDEDE